VSEQVKCNSTIEVVVVVFETLIGLTWYRDRDMCISLKVVWAQPLYYVKWA